MLSRDHFSNVLNEPAEEMASQILKWVVPQIIAAWDDERIDIKQTNDRIIHSIFQHPALRNQGHDGTSDGRRLMFGVVENGGVRRTLVNRVTSGSGLVGKVLRMVKTTNLVPWTMVTDAESRSPYLSLQVRVLGGSPCLCLAASLKWATVVVASVK
jgi:Heterokaryon incompatibility protein Het-C